VVAVRLVREGSVSYRARPRCNSAPEAAAAAVALLRDEPNEAMAVLLLDTKHCLLGASIVARGTINGVHCEPRQVFTPALLANAAAVIVAHNHPSGDPTPSPQDLAITRRFVQAGRILGVGVLDHLVVGANGACVSLRDKGCDFDN
jgi:DNA repair protein RadC